MAREELRRFCAAINRFKFEFASVKNLHEFLNERLEHIERRKAQDNLARHHITYKDLGQVLKPSTRDEFGRVQHVHRPLPGNPFWDN